MGSKPESFKGVQEFLFEAPLYARFQLRQDPSNDISILFISDFKIDGHCPFCGRSSTFNRVTPPWNDNQQSYYWLGGRNYVGDIVIVCARNAGHLIRFNLRVANEVIQKVGQYPSFADIAVDESKTYLSVLSDEDAAELHKAIGLAAHGVGIGSFVYIRRIFERLIQARFDEFKTQEDWSEDDFKVLRMVEKIEFLKNHLPAFLVQNKKLYGILSLGIHELEEQQCLSFFEVIRLSAVIILDEDKKKKEELGLRDKLKRAIADYVPKEEGDGG